jgi:hypothetical protein
VEKCFSFSLFSSLPRIRVTIPALFFSSWSIDVEINYCSSRFMAKREKTVFHFLDFHLQSLDGR